MEAELTALDTATVEEEETYTHAPPPRSPRHATPHHDAPRVAGLSRAEDRAMHVVYIFAAWEN